jgi:hypothetical protein
MYVTVTLYVIQAEHIGTYDIFMIKRYERGRLTLGSTCTVC